MLTDGDEEIVSPSLLVIPECVESNPDLDLGIADWLSDSTVPAPPPPKRLRLTLARSPLRVSNNSGSRFSNPVNSPERAKAARGVVPANTEASTQWAVNNFTDWALNRSFLDSRETVPADLLRSHDAELVCKWMCRFVTSP